MSENMENMEKMDIDELDKVVGGKGSGTLDKGMYTVKVTNGAGANVRKDTSSKSGKVGHYGANTILQGVKDAGKGKEGYSWYFVVGQKGQKSGYIAQHLVKRIY